MNGRGFKNVVGVAPDWYGNNLGLCSTTNEVHCNILGYGATSAVASGPVLNCIVQIAMCWMPAEDISTQHSTLFAGCPSVRTIACVLCAVQIPCLWYES